MTPPPASERPEENRTGRDRAGRTGVWLIGARGSVATCVAYGLAGLRHGLLDPVGVTTEWPPLDRLELCQLDDLVLAGCDVSQRSLTDSTGELVRTGVLPADLVAGLASEAAEFDGRIRPGLLDEADVGVGDLDPESSRRGSLPPREQVEAIRADLDDFASRERLERVIAVNVASTEALREPRPEWESLEAFESALDRGLRQPASILYAYAAFSAGAAHVNFTPSPGASIPALRELARERGLPHCGNDGKTGETLVKTVLAPMFRARALRVLSWQGYNLLGNRDGAVLSDPLHKETKVRGKDEALRAILDDEALHTHVGIDYVPSLRDWKTAWDHVHFEGFLGARMSLQFTWTGSDSALAAPLVIDLVRLTDLAVRDGSAGEMEHVACYFKAPLAGGPHDFHTQHRRLAEWARARSQGDPR